MGYRAGDTYYKEFTISNTAGTATDADSTPTAIANHNGGDDSGFTLTVNHLDTGRYYVTGTIPNYSGGDTVNISISATISSNNVKGVIDSFVLDRLGPFIKNTANGFEIAMYQSTDGKTPYTGGSVSVTREIDGGSSSPTDGSVSQIGTSNRYYFNGHASDFNGNSIAFTFTATGADTVTININTAQ